MFKLATTAVLATAIGLAPVTRAEANNHNNDALGALVVGGLLAIALADAARRAEAQGTPAPDPGHAAPNAEPSQFQLVIGIQTALNYFGFSAGPVDGIPGRGTRGAIQRYQGAMGYPVGNGSLRQHQFEFLMEAYNTKGSDHRPTFTQSLDPIDVMTSGRAIRLFQAWQPASRIAS